MSPATRSLQSCNSTLLLSELCALINSCIKTYTKRTPYNSLEQDGSEIEQPDPPSTLTFHGIMYELNATSSVRQSTDVFNPSGAYESSDSTVVVHENILDLESNQKSAVCQVTCILSFISSYLNVSSGCLHGPFRRRLD